MDTRKTLASVGVGVHIQHKGDLVINGDVGEWSHIKVTDGALVIKGSVRSNAFLQIQSTQPSTPINASIVTMVQSLSSIGGGSVVMSMGGHAGNVGNSIACMMNINGVMMGGVNINNRILTNDQVIDLGHNRYKITPISSYNRSFLAMLHRYNAPSNIAIATIDGKEYQASEIIVDADYGVSLNGQKGNNAGATTIEREPALPAQCLVHGCIDDNVTIESDVDIEIKGDGIGCHTTLTSKAGGLNAHSLGFDVKVDVRNKINVGHVERNCELKSHQYGLEASSLATGVTVHVRDAIDITGPVGDGCVLTSAQCGITVGSVGSNVSITVRDAIEVNGKIGDSCRIVSYQYGLKAGSIGKGTEITVRDKINVVNVGRASKLTSQTDAIHVNNVDSQVVLSARDDVTIYGKYTESVVARSATGKVKKSEFLQLKDPTPETDLQRAIQLSQAETLKTQGVFPAPVVIPNANVAPKKTPDAYICSISLCVMEDPVICLLDGITYERYEITKWLESNRISPTRVKMEESMKVSDVLVSNRSLKNAISEFRTANPELFAAPKNYKGI